MYWTILSRHRQVLEIRCIGLSYLDIDRYWRFGYWTILSRHRQVLEIRCIGLSYLDTDRYWRLGVLDYLI